MMKKKKKLSRKARPANPEFSPAGFYEEAPFLKNIFNYMTDELVIIDDRGRFVCVNDAAVEGMGYRREYILKRNVVDFLHEKMSVRQWKKRHFDQLKKRRMPLSYRIEREPKSGGVQILDITAVYLSYKQKDLIFSFGKDVTRQVQTQRAFEESKNLYHLLAEGAGDGIAALDAKGALIYANKAFMDLMGLEDYKKKKIFSVFSRHARMKVKAILDMALISEAQSHGVVEILSLSGNAFPVEISMTPLLKSGQAVTIHMIVRDLRPRRNLERMERQEEKMEALRSFVSGTAQELKNPLMGLVRRTEVLLKKYADRDFEYISYREFQDMVVTMRTVRDQIQYCYETAQRLTAVGQKKAGMKRGHCYVNQIISGVMKDKEIYMRQCDVKAKVFFANRDVEVRMSAVDLIQVLNNLLDNAIQSMPSGGVLTVKTSLFPKGGNAVIEVRDQGVGIPKDQMEHIFEPFFTTKFRGVQKNSGLGLPIVHALVGASQGEMYVSSSLRHGTVVTVSLPIYRLSRKKV